MTFRTVCDRVCNPDKVRDVAYLMCKFALTYNRNGYMPVIVFIGAGTKDAYYKNIKLKREIELVSEYFKIKNIPLQNIICVDADPEVCEQWRITGVTVIHSNWRSKMLYYNIRRKIQELRPRPTMAIKILMYANTFGRAIDCNLYKQMIAIVKPHRFLGLYGTRPTSIASKLHNFKKYKLADLGFLENSKNKLKGCVVYRGIAMCIFDKLIRR